jgi:hypothetical protein
MAAPATARPAAAPDRERPMKRQIGLWSGEPVVPVPATTTGAAPARREEPRVTVGVR